MIHYSNSYAGPRWRYALRNRPLDIDTAPRDYIIWSSRPYPRYPHGTIDYARPLTEREVHDYEMDLVDVVPVS